MQEAQSTVSQCTLVSNKCLTGIISISGRFFVWRLSRSSDAVVIVSNFSLSKRDWRKIGSSRTGDRRRPVPKNMKSMNSLIAIQGRTTSIAKESYKGMRNWMGTSRWSCCRSVTISMRRYFGLAVCLLGYHRPPVGPLGPGSDVPLGAQLVQFHLKCWHQQRPVSSL